MGRSRESLWLWAGTSFVAAGAALGGVAGALAAARPGYRLWSSAPMAGAYVACALALACLWAAVRDWPFPFTTDRSGRVAGERVWRGPPAVAWVDRAELEEVVSALTNAGDGTVALTTGLVGAGGFGKTMLAARACQARAVRRRFPGGVCWITVGQNLEGEGLAQRISEAVWNLGGEGHTFASLEEAARALAVALAARPSMLLVADDVWTTGQLAPFVTAGQAARLLVTTRRPVLLPRAGTRQVKVDAVPEEVARRILSRGLPQIPDRLEADLLELAGGWPLLLSLINGRLAGRRGDIDAAAGDAVGRLRRDGPAALDIEDSESRELAVKATIGYSADMLDADDYDRFCSLALFAEDAEIPVPLISALWQAMAPAGISDAGATALCERLDGLSLVSLAGAADKHVVVIHDVIRDFLRTELGSQRLAGLHGVLLDAVAAGLAAATSGVAGPGPERVPWWELDRDDRYLWDHLIEHLRGAGRSGAAEAVAGDLRWAGARLERAGPLAPVADLALTGTPRAARLSAVLARAAHLLAPTQPPAAVIDVLYSRVGGDPDWGPQVTAMRKVFRRPRLVNRWPVPDLPDSRMQRVLDDGLHRARRLAVAPDGSWLAVGGFGMVRIWDTATWQSRIGFVGGAGPVDAMAVSADGSWLATGSDDGLRIWDTATWQTKASFTVRELVADFTNRYAVTAVAVAPGGSWLVTCTGWGTVRVWDTATWQTKMVFTDLEGARAVAVAPDGTWLAAASGWGVVQVWDAASWQPLATLTDGAYELVALAVAPDGSWLAAVGGDHEGAAMRRSGAVGKVQTWNTASWQPLARLTGHADMVRAVAVAPDGSWLATSSYNAVRVWSTATWQEKASLAGHGDMTGQGDIDLAVAPDGAWLASCGEDGKVRIWDTVALQPGAARASRTHVVRAIVAAPDGSWLATSGDEQTAAASEADTRFGAGTVRIWDAATAQPRAALTCRFRYLKTPAVAVAPDGIWLATDDDRGVRIWDTARWQPLATLSSCPYSYRAVAVARDGGWLATGNDSEILVWDTATWQRVIALTGHAETVETVAFAGNGSWLATSSYDAVRVWDTTTWQTLATLTGHFRIAAPGPVMATAADGSWLATGGRHGKVRIWNTASWQSRTVSIGHFERGWVSAAASSPDTSWLATIAEGDKTLRIWDTATWLPLATLAGQVQTSAIAVAPDGNWLATAGEHDQTVRIWDTATWHPRAVMRVDNAIRACAWLGTDGLAIGGTAGLYVFDFLNTLPQST